MVPARSKLRGIIRFSGAMNFELPEFQAAVELSLTCLGRGIYPVEVIPIWLIDSSKASS